ncbi:MAG: crossover junction endodeoxyribonuclease RuvC [Actinomycetota bacterium]
MFVLGIDPGLSRCGYGVVEQRGRYQRAVAAGVIRTEPSENTPDRLAELQSEVRSLISDFRPSVVALERVLFQNNVRTAMSVGQASGIVMAEAINAQCTVIEYSPNEIKQAIAGDGSADKEQMETMVRLLLDIQQPLRPVDAADALGVALCHLARHGVPEGMRA